MFFPPSENSAYISSMESLKTVQSRIAQAAIRAGRDPKEIRLVAVSKGQPVGKIRTLAVEGHLDFGENYAQELLDKAAQLATEPDAKKISWHFLGHLQKNKAGKVLGLIRWLHSLDSYPLALAIEKRAQEPLKCLLEIRLSPEESKSGLEPSAALELIPQLKPLKKIELKGLMTMAPFTQNPEEARPFFKKLFELLKEINRRYLYSSPLTELSMGMSHDFEIAVEEGATMVRIGEAIFGSREHYE